MNDGTEAKRDRAFSNDEIERLLPLVNAVAVRYARSRADIDDLVQAGSLGLVKAAKNYDPARGTKLSTYAFCYIEGEILNSLCSSKRSACPMLMLSTDSDLDEANMIEEAYAADTSGEERMIDTINAKRIIGYLSTNDQTIVRLRFIYGLSQTETARRLGVTQSCLSKKEKACITRLRGLFYPHIRNKSDHIAQTTDNNGRKRGFRK